MVSGVDVNVRGKDGITSLFCAIAWGNHDGFVRLLKRSANPDQQDPKMDFVRGSSVTSVAARRENDPFFLEVALKHGANPNLIEPRDHTTPIYQVIMSHRIRNLELLIRAGADLNHRGGHFGTTPLIDAACQDWYEGVYRLLEAGADYRIKAASGPGLPDFVVMESIAYTPENRLWKDKVLDFLKEKGVDLEAARRRAEAKGLRTTKSTAGD